MGWVLMSAWELKRVEVLAQVDDGTLDATAAANVLCVTRRHLFRLLRRYREDGAASLGHKARGRVPNNKHTEVRRKFIIALVREKYPDFGPTLAAESIRPLSPP